MSLNHLSDEQIQAYIEQKNETSEAHLRQCEECRNTYRHYVTLQKKLSRLPEPKLSVDFSSKIMADIKAESVVDRSSWMLVGLTFLLSLISTGITVWLFGWQKSVSFAQEYIPNISLQNITMYKMMSTFIETHASIIGILLFAAIIISFFSVLDKILAKTKTTRLSIFSI